MDTSGLASSLSLAAFLVVFAYLSLVEHTTPSGNATVRSTELLSRLLFTLRFLRLACVMAAVLSAQALVFSQSSPGVPLIAIVALDLLAFLVITDRGTRLVSLRYPGVVANLASYIRFPLLRLLSLPTSDGAVSLGPGRGSQKERNGVTPDALDAATVVITEEEQAEWDTRERLMIRSILRLDELTAREIMVPRVDIVALDADTSLTEVARRMLESGHSRLPVYNEVMDNIMGVVYSRDLLPFLGETEAHLPLERVIRPAFFIPESKRLDELLKELQERHVQMAMVVDEYGGTEGLITLEDLLEEIVGEIEDEFYRSREPRVVPMANGDTLVDARVTLEYLSDFFSTSIGHEDVDTVGGLVYSTLGKMPGVGDEVVFNGLRIEVVSLLGRRIGKLKLSRVGTQEPQ